jgi:putative DNA primase/helicase
MSELLDPEAEEISFEDAVGHLPQAQRTPPLMAVSKPDGGFDPASSLDLRSATGRTGMANGRRLAGMFFQELRWRPQLRVWFAWDGRRWAIDRQQRAEAMAKLAVDQLWQDVSKLLPDVSPAVAGAMLAHAKSSASKKGIHDMIDLAKSEPGIAILPEQFDSDPWLLNVNDGTVDLRTGVLRDHRRDDFMTKLAPHVFIDGGVVSPLFDKFLLRIFAGKTNLIEYVQRLFGMALVGQVYEHVLPILWGKHGANGKSVLCESVMFALGDYAAQAPPGLLIAAKGHDRHPTELADLAGRRAVFCVETDEDRRLSEARVKQLTGGDRVRGRFMRKDFFEFPASYTIFIVSNHLPIIRGSDDAFWRRPRVVPFNVVIPIDERDTGLTDKLKLDAAAILAWAVRGCLEWKRVGLRDPVEVVEATNQFRRHMDVMADFIEECCVTGPQFVVRAGDLYSTYKTWCEQHGENKLSGRAFGMHMSGREDEFERFKSSGRWYRGIGLKNDLQ